MTKLKIGTRDQWLKARLKLLQEEKKLTHQSDELARKRQELPWVRVNKSYQFDTDKGKASLVDLFRGRSQLLVYHFMFGPDYKAGCPSCSSIADSFNGVAPHLANHDVMFWAVSRAPLPKLKAFKKRMGWTFPWASAAATDFNADFNVWFTEDQQRQGIEYNYVREPGMDPKPSRAAGGPSNYAAMTGTDMPTYIRERPGLSAFARKGDAIYHTYSAYARGLDAMWNMYQWLDRAPKGRNETGDIWWRYRDEYKDEK